MGYQEHWNRNKDAEGKAIHFSWRNKHNQRTVEVIETDRETSEGYSIYEVDEDGIPIDETFTNKEKAKKKAQSIMERKSYDDTELSGDELHSKLLEVGREVEPSSGGVGNDLSEADVETFVTTVKVFGSRDKVVAQAYADLTDPYYYRVFDHMGMMLDGGDLTDKEEWLYEKFANIYIEEKSVDGFIQRLRTDDLLVEYRSEQ